MTDQPSLSSPDSSLSPDSTGKPGILVVDDDQMLLALLQRVFQGQGFNVWQAASGHLALDLYRRHQEHIAVVLLDVRMPGLDGPSTLTELRSIDPFVTCCFMTGHAGDYPLDDLEELGAVACFDKPFRTHEMAEQLWRLAHERLRRSA
jgi:CheY-like chemotaxis protein